MVRLSMIITSTSIPATRAEALQYPLIKEIMRQADYSIHLQQSLVRGAMMEGTKLLGPWPSGDGGCARGPFQIRYEDNPCDKGNRWNGHPVTIAEAENPTTAVAYAISPKGLNYHGNSLKYSNQVDVVFQSERPSRYYSAGQQKMAQDAIDLIWGKDNNNRMPVLQPVMTRYPVHSGNYTVGRGGISLEAVVYHLAVGTMTGMRSWFNSIGAQSSTNFGVSKTGLIDLYVDLVNTPYAHGIVEVSFSVARKLIQDNWGINPNLWAASVEFEGTVEDVQRGIVPTDAQRATAAHLSAWLFTEVFYDPAAEARPPIDRDHVLMHRDVSPNSRTCPVWDEDKHSVLIDDIHAFLRGQNSSPPLPPADDSKDILIRKLVDGITVQAQESEKMYARLATELTAMGIQTSNLRKLIEEARY